MLNPHSGKFLTVVSPNETKIRSDNNNEDDDDDHTEQLERPEQPQQLEQLEESDMEIESDMELDVSVVSVDFDSMTL